MTRFNTGGIGLVALCCGFLALMAWTGALIDIDGLKMRSLAWLVEDVIVKNLGRDIGAGLIACVGIVIALFIKMAARPSAEQKSQSIRRSQTRTAAAIEGETAGLGDGLRRRVISTTTIEKSRTSSNSATEARPISAKRPEFGEPAPLEQFDITNADDVLQIKARREPALWHQMVIATLVYHGNPHGFVQWALLQPETDRATAAWIFLWIGGANYLHRETIPPTVHLSGDELMELLYAAIHRSETMGFENDNLGLHANYEAERLKCLHAEEKSPAPDVAVPTVLLQKTFAPPRLSEELFRWDIACARSYLRPMPLPKRIVHVELDITNGNDVLRIKGRREPALWHIAAIAAIAYKGDPHSFLPWLIEQPETDRATAGWIFLWNEGSRFLKGETDFNLNSGVRDLADVLRAICVRSEDRGFENDILGLDSDFEAERLKCLSVIENGNAISSIVAPIALLAQPFDQPACDDRFTVDDGMIVCEEST
jgi:hypothetical protein